MTQQEYDVMIVGGGLAGVMMAARVHDMNPNASILLLEKDTSLGGRISATSRGQHRWGYGFSGLTRELFDFWNQSMKLDPESQDLPHYAEGSFESLGIFAASKMTTVSWREAFGKEGARAIAGGAAVRDWGHIEKFLQDVNDGDKGDQAFAQVYGGNRKSPSALVAEQLSQCWGIPDLWTATAKAVVERSEMWRSGLIKGRWNEAIAAMLGSPRIKERLTVLTEARVVNGKKQDGLWLIDTGRGPFVGKRLVVAQSPWEAVQWLAKDAWPTSLLTIASKTKPASVVMLTETMSKPVPLPDTILIPAENAQVMVEGRELCFQATLNYELTVQAPEVVKAIKALRRARKKLTTAIPELELSGEHLALLPVGWAQPTACSERRWMEKLEKGNFQSKDLVFCGDAYGESFNGDKNLMSSVLSACEWVTKSL